MAKKRKITKKGSANPVRNAEETMKTTNSVRIQATARGGGTTYSCLHSTAKKFGHDVLHNKSRSQGSNPQKKRIPGSVPIEHTEE